MRRSVLIFFVALFFAGTPFFSFNARAVEENALRQQIDDRNKEILKLEEEIKKYQSNLDETETTAKTLNQEIARLNAEIKRLNSSISLTQKKISKKVLEIKQLSLDIKDTAATAEERRSAMGVLLQRLREQESQSSLEILLTNKTVSEFFDTLESIKQFDNSVRKNFEELKTLKTDLETQKSKAEAARRELATLKRDLLNQREIQEDGKVEKTELLKATKNQEALYQKLLQDREKRRAQIYEEIRTIENDLKKQIDLSSLPAFRRGILQIPIDGGVVTQEFGYTSFSRHTDVYGNGFHNGIDFRAPIGTPLRAAEGGTGKATGNIDIMCPRGSYGKWVLIEHPNKLATLYAHLSLVRVSPRQEISRGDIIGYSGNTGYTTGPHLHFTVYDARTVELRQSRVCGVLPYGGYLNPLNYL